MRKKKIVKSSSLPVIKNTRIDDLYERVSGYIEKARYAIQKSIDVEMVKAYWFIGRDIVLEEQHGQMRAEYGRRILQDLSIKLQNKYKTGFSVDTLERARKFYLVYPETIASQKSATLLRKSKTSIVMPNLSWSHYIELIRITRAEARNFYALEAAKNNWNVRELKRQIASFLFDRISKRKDKNKVLRLAYKGHEINTPEDAIKEPLVLEFLGAPQPHKMSETKLETALINNLQQFLLELGKGFAFIGRQRRITFDNDHYYADLVLYHVILKCYVIIDIKTHKLTHADLGQMQLYVNYFDQEIKMDNDNPTIGLVLCTAKSDAMARYLLGEKNKQIFASTYQFHLPTEEELKLEVQREVKKIQQDLTEKL
jgi:predicted nuclease of restriction endonuclease-like (RecB) superfamily